MIEEKNREEQSDDRPLTTDDGTSSSSEENKTLPDEGAQPSTLNIQPPTSKEMEVHHHGHVHEKKKWKEYVFQFLMLFLAVFCGFLAEYQLEHKIEKDRERKYIKSFYEDLADDERNLKQLVRLIDIQLRASDTLQMMLPDADIKTKGNSIYTNFRKLFRQLGINLYLNDRTIVQLRNSGGMRLIQNKQVSDSIVRYYQDAEKIQFLQDIMLEYRKSLRESVAPLLHGSAYEKSIDSTDRVVYPADTLLLRTVNRDAINNCLLYLSDIEGLNIGLKRSVVRLINKATNIKRFIASKYDLQNQSANDTSGVNKIVKKKP